MNKVYCLTKLTQSEEQALRARFFSAEPTMCVCRYFGLILKSDGNVELIGQPHEQTTDWKPFRAEEWTGVVKLYKSEKHIVGLKHDGTVTACGCNDKNQCETDSWQNIKEIYISEDATAGIDQNGTVHYTYTFQRKEAKTAENTAPQHTETPPSANMTAVSLPEITTPQVSEQPAQNAPSQQPAANEKNFNYNWNDDDTITILKYTGHESDITVPRTIQGRVVTSIGERAFSGYKNLTSVIIPDSVTSIKKRAFSECNNLVALNIPNSVTSIGDWAFRGCDILTIYCSSDSYAEQYAKENGIPFHIEQPVSEPVANETVFEHELNADGTITILKYTGNEPIVTIPHTINGKTVTGIADGAFWKCNALITVTIPNSVTSIGKSAFYGCENLIALSVPNGVTSIEEGTFSRCKNLTSVIIPNSVTSIKKRAFSDCTSLTSVTIPDSVTSIESWAFLGCPKLIIHGHHESYAEKYAKKNKITFHQENSEENTTNEEVFEHKLNANGTVSITGYKGKETDVIIPRTIQGRVVTSIGESAFSECDHLTSVTIPDSVTSIGNGAFVDCTSLTSVTIPDSVTDIGEKAFSRCKSLISVIIPNSVTSIGKLTFSECDHLTSVIIPNSVTSIGEGAFYKCGSLAALTIPNSVTSIGKTAFSGCENLSSVTIPDSVTSIEEEAFSGCKHLSSLTIPYGVKSIGNGAFYECKSLTSVSIPDSVTSIGDWAFLGCQKLTLSGSPKHFVKKYAKMNKIPFLPL